MGPYIYTSSLREFLRFKRLWPWIGLSVVGMALAIAWPSLSMHATHAEVYTAISGMLLFHVLALSSAIYTTAVVSQEVEQKTIVYLLTRPIARWELLLFRYLASVTVVSILGIIGVLLVSVATYGGNFMSNPLFQKDIIAMVFGAFAYGALFLLISLLMNRAMILCLLYAFGWEVLVPNMPGEMYRLALYSYVSAIGEHPTASGGPVGFASGNLSTNVLTAGSAYVTLILFTAVLVTVSAAWFTRSEIVPREDAE
jgi:ABC-2 type transport system permease protein